MLVNSPLKNILEGEVLCNIADGTAPSVGIFLYKIIKGGSITAVLGGEDIRAITLAERAETTAVSVTSMRSLRYTKRHPFFPLLFSVSFPE